jgi:glucose-1-phosphate cytidylyltransferase
MKCVIFAGGLGSRLGEETVNIPKPLVRIGRHPIIWHIMKIYASYNINEFIICAGYMSYKLKEYFFNFYKHENDLYVDLSNGECSVLSKSSEDWKVTIVDTGLSTMTGGRLKRVSHLLDDTFCLTYGDGVGDVNINSLIRSHQKSGLMATVTGVKPIGRFGVINYDHEIVTSFDEKSEAKTSVVNGGFFVLEPSVIEFIKDDTVSWEADPMLKLCANRQLGIYKHNGFWHPMDTLRDKIYLSELWNSGDAPWMIWS